MRIVYLALLVGCTNEPQYVTCAPMGPAPNDKCSIEADAMSDLTTQSGTLHVPVMPDSMWSSRDRNEREDIQMTVADGVEVPIYRLEHYDLSVEWTVTNLDASPGTFFVDLNGANEMITYDPSIIDIDPTSDEDPPAPPLAGNIPFDIAPNGTLDGTFREDQLLEAAINLDQMSRGGWNPFKAELTVSKNDNFFTDTGGLEVPRVAFRQLVRVDIVFRPDRHMRLDFTLRVREHKNVVHEMGLNAPDGEIMIYDPPDYTYP